MLKISTNLPFGRRLYLSLVKKRRVEREDSIIPKFSVIKNTRAGNKISRYFRHIFAHNKLKKIMGSNLAVAIFAGSIFTNHFSPIVTAYNEPDISFIENTKTPLNTRSGLQIPVEKVVITQRFNLFHPGVDLAEAKGSIVKSMMEGKVEYIEYSRFDYGNAVIVNHGNGVKTLYAHLSKIDVVVGQEVNLDTQIGEVGATGHATGNHLHFEIREDGKSINPSSILQLQ